MKRSLGSLVFAVCLAVAQTTTRADLILDQEFAPADPNTHSVIGELTKAQTFTVGMDGKLGRVEVLLDSSPGLPALDRTFQIIPTTGGVPVYGTAPLASFTIALPAGDVALGFFGADLTSFDLQVHEGDLLAIVTPGAPIPENGYWWVGRFTAPPTYADGAFYTTIYDGRDPDTTFHLLDEGSVVYDYGFRTWLSVDGGGPITPPSPVPEPGTMVLIGLGLAALGIAKRK